MRGILKGMSVSEKYPKHSQMSVMKYSCEKSKRLKTVNYFRINLYPRCLLTGP